MATKTVYDIPENATRTVELANARLNVTLMKVDDGSLVGHVTLDLGNGKPLESRIDALLTPAQNTTFETALKSLGLKLIEANSGVAREVEIEAVTP